MFGWVKMFLLYVTVVVLAVVTASRAGYAKRSGCGHIVGLSREEGGCELPMFGPEECDPNYITVGGPRPTTGNCYERNFDAGYMWIYINRLKSSVHPCELMMYSLESIRYVYRKREEHENFLKYFTGEVEEEQWKRISHTWSEGDDVDFYDELGDDVINDDYFGPVDGYDVEVVDDDYDEL
jgi:hypothetical protein